MVIDLFVHIFRRERDVIVHRTTIYNFEIGRTECTCARTESQTRCDVIEGNNLFLAYLIAVHVEQSVRCHVQQREVDLLAISRQRIEDIGLKLRFQYQMSYRFSVVICLRAHDHIAGTNRTIPIDLQTRGTVLPTAVVLLNLADTAVTHRDTECIDDIDVIAFPILHIDRTIETADNIVVPVVRGRFMRRTVFLRNSGAHTTITNELKILRHTEVLIQI